MKTMKKFTYKSIKEKIKKIPRPNGIQAMFLLSFLLWCFSFRGFLSGTLALDSDAVSYYGHIRFYLENISRGVYPMWESARSLGVPIEFFMRRIGSFNPLYFTILFLERLGFSSISAYMLFLAIYYFLGMVGFYLLSLKIFQDTRSAFLAYLLLMFSSLGTRLFDSYFLLTFIPMIWFFNFLFAFAQRPERHFFLGITFTLMILLTTYIPFYFITIFLVFMLCFSAFYFHCFKDIFRRTMVFFKAHKILTCLCVMAILISLLPGFLFYMDSGKMQVPKALKFLEPLVPGESKTIIPDEGEGGGGLVLSERHAASSEKNVISVGIETIKSWGIEEDIAFTKYYDLKDFQFAMLYIPVFIFPLFLMGAAAVTNRRLLVLLVFGVGLYFVCSPHAPFYQFLYDHVFYFKYFRNLHFFLWIALLPVFILFIAELFNMIINYEPSNRNKRNIILVSLVIAHLVVAVFISNLTSPLISSYAVLVLSLIFFICHFTDFFSYLKFSLNGRDGLADRKTVYLFCLVVLVTLQPMEVYHYFNKNAAEFLGKYRYHGYKGDIDFELPEKVESLEERLQKAKEGWLNLK